MLEIRIHGYGGQGAVTLAHLLAQAALASGRQSQALPSFGVERRGAPVKAAVRVADEPIMVFSQSFAPNILILMDKKLLAQGLAEGVAPGATILADATAPLDVAEAQYTVDATGIATEEGLMGGGAPLVNIPLLGAVAKIIGVPMETLEATLREKWPGAAGDKNVQVARRAYDAVRKAGQ